MTSKKLFYILASVVALILLCLCVLGYKSHSILSGGAEKLAVAKAKAQVASEEITLLARNKSDINKYSELNKIAKSVVPQDKDQAEAVREIVNIAAQSGISQLTSITFPASTLGTSHAGAGSAQTGGITQVTPVAGISGVYDLQITITQDSSHDVSYDTFINFLTKLEQNRRTAQVNSITINPDSQNPDRVSFTLIIDEYIRP
jgi:hypothetical protein